jgi:ADP-ribosyl-[dinitrogen reductase] hydrolase
MRVADSDRFRGCLLGLAVGDAVGATVEFMSRGTFEPVTDMVGGGPHALKPGEWTDDTSMALCLATSLIEKAGHDPRDQMERYRRWHEDGYLSSTGSCFDIGSTVSAALRRYRETGDPIAGSADPHSAGNGCIMRLAPVPMFYFPDEHAVRHYSLESARTTHGAAECLDACRLFGGMLFRALRGDSKERVLFADAQSFDGTPSIMAIARGEYQEKAVDQIVTLGHVVATLEAAAWCFSRTSSFGDAVLLAANLGDDADTTGAVCGQLAGAFYGANDIPERWRQRLVMHNEIVALSDRLREA